VSNIMNFNWFHLKKCDMLSKGNVSQFSFMPSHSQQDFIGQSLGYTNLRKFMLLKATSGVLSFESDSCSCERKVPAKSAGFRCELHLYNYVTCMRSCRF
jgi:hypothetical protein